MKVLVTGAAGFLGTETCRALHSSGVDFRATDVRVNGQMPWKLSVTNLLNREACYGLIDGCDVVVHLGNHPNERSSDAQHVFGENCTMNGNIFQAAMELGVRKIIYASSIQAMVGLRTVADADTVRSRLAYVPTDGDMPARPGNHYSCSKAAAEQFLKSMVEYRQFPSAVAIRLPGMFTATWFGHFRRNNSGGRIWSGANVDEGFAWLSFADAARLVAAVVQADLPGYRCYQPAHPAPSIDLTPREIIMRFFQGVPLKKPIDQITSIVDISRITAETGWTPQDDFRKEPAPAK